MEQPTNVSIGECNFANEFNTSKESDDISPTQSKKHSTRKPTDLFDGSGSMQSAGGCAQSECVCSDETICMATVTNAIAMTEANDADDVSNNKIPILSPVSELSELSQLSLDDDAFKNITSTSDEISKCNKCFVTIRIFITTISIPKLSPVPLQRIRLFHPTCNVQHVSYTEINKFHIDTHSTVVR